MLRTALTGFSSTLDEAIAGLPSSALEGVATALLTSTHTQRSRVGSARCVAGGPAAR